MRFYLAREMVLSHFLKARDIGHAHSKAAHFLTLSWDAMERNYQSTVDSRVAFVNECARLSASHGFVIVHEQVLAFQRHAHEYSRLREHHYRTFLAGGRRFARCW